MYFLQRAHNQVLRLTELIRDVSIINKVEEAPETMTKEIIHPAEIMDDVLEELRAKIEEAGIKTESLIPQDTEVYGNYSLVYSIFRNLVENSVRYAGQGVTIHAECYKSGDDFCYFLFYDTGKGCPEKHLPRLFERFYRAEEGRTRELGGSEPRRFRLCATPLLSTTGTLRGAQPQKRRTGIPVHTAKKAVAIKTIRQGKTLPRSTCRRQKRQENPNACTAC